jgi:hypothetical protein
VSVITKLLKRLFGKGKKEASTKEKVEEVKKEWGI